MFFFCTPMGITGSKHSRGRWRGALSCGMGYGCMDGCGYGFGEISSTRRSLLLTRAPTHARGNKITQPAHKRGKEEGGMVAGR